MSELKLVTRENLQKFGVDKKLYFAYKRSNKRALVVAGHGCYAMFTLDSNWYSIDHISYPNTDDLMFFLSDLSDFADKRNRSLKVNVCYQDVELQKTLADFDFTSIVSVENEDIYTFYN
jgi:hypothetical protein